MKLALAIADTVALPSAFVVYRGFRKSIPKAARLGYDGVELALKTAGEIDAGQLATWLDQAGMEVSCISTGQVFDGSCINITMWSYCEHANLCILADDTVIEDGWVPFACFVEELDQLIELIPAATPEQEPNL